MRHPRPLLRLFLVFSKKQYKLDKKLMWKNVHPLLRAGIGTHAFSPITTRPGLPPKSLLTYVCIIVNNWKISVVSYLLFPNNQRRDRFYNNRFVGLNRRICPSIIQNTSTAIVVDSYYLPTTNLWSSSYVGNRSTT